MGEAVADHIVDLERCWQLLSATGIVKASGGGPFECDGGSYQRIYVRRPDFCHHNVNVQRMFKLEIGPWANWTKGNLRV